MENVQIVCVFYSDCSGMCEYYLGLYYQQKAATVQVQE